MDEHEVTAPPRLRTGAIVAFSAALLAVLYPMSRWDYLVFHSVAESFSTLVAVGIFVIAWNTRKINENTYLPVLGCGLLFTGLMTLLHMLAYKGMGVFPVGGANLPTQLWIISRLFAAAAFLVAGVSLHRKLPLAGVLTGFTLVWFAAMASLFVWPVFPVMYGDAGLTPLKIALEYVVMAMFAVSGWLVWSRRSVFADDIQRMLLVAVGAMIAAEMSFTLYTDIYGVLNFLGHWLVLIGNVLIYTALIDIALTRPYDLLFRELKRREEDERRIADVLQGALLSAPDRIASVSVGVAYRSATSGARVGGDFYDLFTPAPGIVAFAIGDVCGKGIEAAAATAMVRTTMRSFAFVDPGPIEVLRRTNEVVAREFPDDKFVTVVYGVVDTTTGVMRVAAAGHPDPVLRDAAGARVLGLPRNPPLGVLSDPEYTEVEVTLHPGDMIVLYTDGLLDAGWEFGAFGIDRVVAGTQAGGAHPNEVVESLLQRAVAFAQAALSDDVAVVGLQFQPAWSADADVYVP